MAETKTGRSKAGTTKKKTSETQSGDIKPELTIEESLEQLEEILSKLENQDSPLEESFGFYEEGMKLVKHCQAQIDRVEKQIQILEEDEHGEF